MIRHLPQDLRFAVRTLTKRPLFTAVAVATLALGIGANTAVFSVVNGILLRPLRYAAPEQLVSVWPERFISYGELEVFQERLGSMQSIDGVVASWNAALTGEGEPAQLKGARPTAGLFATLGVEPALGRVFEPRDGLVGAEAVALISYEVWNARFGGDPTLIDRRITLDGVPHTVIGVMPPGFELVQRGTQVWLPLVNDPEEWYQRGGAMLAIGRLAEGATIGGADQELRGLASAMSEVFGFPDDYDEGASIIPLKDRLVGDVRTTLFLLLGAVGAVLLIAGANLGNLLLARASGRSREIAVRAALGASRGRIVSQLLAESLVLGIAGGLAGLLLAFWSVRAIVTLLPADTPRLGLIGLHGEVLAICAMISIGSALVFGLAPALLATRTDLRESLQGRGTAAGASRGGQRLRGAFVVAEVALALILVVGAGLMTRTLWNLNQVDPGFDTRNVLTMSVQPTSEGLRTRDARRVFYSAVFERISALPGVLSVGAIQHLPLSGGSWGTEIDIEGQPLAAGARPRMVGWRVINEGYFASMRIPLRRGRTFESRDMPGAAPVILVNEALASRYWPAEDPLGRRIRAGQATAGEWATVVGVVGDVRHSGLEREAVPEIYRPLTQYTHGGMTLAIRTESSPALLARPVQETIWSVNPDVPISRVRTLD